MSTCYTIGIDVGGTTVKLGIFTTDGDLLRKWEVDTCLGENGRAWITDVAEELKTALQEQSISPERVVGVGMGIPGPVEPDGHVTACVNLGLKDCYPGKELSALFYGKRVYLTNDANAAALGELWKGAAQGWNSVCLATLGTGVGGGIVIDGKIVVGAHGSGGEIGHMCVKHNETEACNCGSHGCVEQYASARGIVRVARRMMASTDEPSAMREFEGHFNAKVVCDFAKAGDALALRSLRYSMQKLALAFSQVALCIDPEVFVIGGGVSRAGAFLTDLILEYLRPLTPIIHAEPKVVIAQLGNDAGIYGAARLAMSDPV